MWVIDASVAVRWLLLDQEHPHASVVLERVARQPSEFAVPELFGFEVFAVLCREHPRPVDAFLRGVLPLLEGGVLRLPVSARLVCDGGEFAAAGLSGYDATYAALARSLGGRWLTFDHKAHRRLVRKGFSVSWLLSEGLPEGWGG